MPPVRVPAVRAAALLMSVAALRLGGQAPPPIGASRQGASPVDGATVGVASGVVTRATAGGERPVANRWVLLHRIRRTADSVTGAAVDSTRTDRTGRFRLQYTIVPDDSATYFVSTSHHGLAYVSNPLAPDAGVDAASLSVYDTTSAAVPISIASRHVIIFAPDSTGAHRVAEIYALSNNGVVTRVPPADGSPVWSAAVPSGATNLMSGLESAAPDSVRLENGRVAAFSPFAPGVKRLAFAYFLAPARPVSIPIESATSALEVLVEGPGGVATGAGLVEVSPMSIEGRNFRRFQAQEVVAPTAVLVDMGGSVAARRPPALLVALGIAIVLTAGVVIADRRRRRVGAAAAPAPVIGEGSSPIDAEADALARRIAELDREFARETAPSDEARERHQALRTELKRQLSARLAARSGH